MDTQTGILHLTYNAMWGHYAFHWASHCGSSVEDDGGEVREIIENFKGDVNNPKWFIQKAESELDFEIEEGNIFWKEVVAKSYEPLKEAIEMAIENIEKIKEDII